DLQVQLIRPPIRIRRGPSRSVSARAARYRAIRFGCRHVLVLLIFVQTCLVCFLFLLVLTGLLVRFAFAGLAPHSSHRAWISSDEPSTVNSPNADQPASRRSKRGISRSRMRRHFTHTT